MARKYMGNGFYRETSEEFDNTRLPLTSVKGSVHTYGEIPEDKEKRHMMESEKQTCVYVVRFGAVPPYEYDTIWWDYEDACRRCGVLNEPVDFIPSADKRKKPVRDCWDVEEVEVCGPLKGGEDGT